MDYPIKTLQQLRPILVGLRKKAGLSQADLAMLLGITQQSYAKIEAKPATTSVARLFTILRLLNAELLLTQNMRSGTGGSSAQEASTSTPQHLPNFSTPASSRTNKKKVPAPSKINPPVGKKEDW